MRDPALIKLSRKRPAAIFLYAFDLLELDGQDLRREPLETRKATLASLLRFCGLGLGLRLGLKHGGEVAATNHLYH
jgi:hypothetical protein